MVSFVQQTIFFLAGVSLVVSVPPNILQKNGGQISTNQEVNQDSANTLQTDLNAANVLDCIGSISELSDEQREALKNPVGRLINNFEGTLFGSLFKYIMKRLENPDDFTPSELDQAELFKKTPDALKAFISTLQDLPEKVIQDSQDEFGEIFEILGNSKFATFVREIFTTLKMRQDLFRFAKMGNEMLKNLPNMFADISQNGIENVQQLIQNPEAMAALMPSLAELQSSSPAGVTTLQRKDIKNFTTSPVETINAAKRLANRLKVNAIPRVDVPRVEESKVEAPKIILPRTGSFQQKIRNLPSFRPAILDAQPTMQV